MITNKWGLPNSIADALKGDDYDLEPLPNVYSATRLVDSAKYRVLQARHKAEVEEDVSERLWMLLGHSVHYVIQAANAKAHDRLSEERLFVRVSDWTVHTLNPGQKVTEAAWYDSKDLYVAVRFDNYDQADEALEDYKVTSVWSSVYQPEGKPEHIAQVNIGAFATRLLGFQVTKGRVISILKDWTQREADRSQGNYPPIPIATVDVPMWSDDYTKEYLIARLDAHRRADMTDFEDEIPACSPEERWYKAGKVAVYKNANKTALRLFDDTPMGMQMAKSAVEALEVDGCKGRIEKRPGEDVRCRSYCKFARWCDHGRQYVNETVDTAAE